jgi:membrane protease YdiL (CAAX protease family)
MAAIFFSSILTCANEELAWRGFAQTRLQKKRRSLRASLVVGFFWGLIHRRLCFIQPERSGGFPIPGIIPLFILLTVFLSVLYAYQFNRTGGSVLLATLFHTSMNSANELYSSPVTDHDLTALVLFFGIVTIIALYLIIRMGYSGPANPS